MGKNHSKSSIVQTALQAISRGYQPVPVRSGVKGPQIPGWTRLRWDPADTQGNREAFEKYYDDGMTNIGVLTGEPSAGLVDVDLDHPRTIRLKDHFLPPTAMRTGRIGNPNSHYWYKVTGDIPGNRRYMMSDGTTVSVELRSTLLQTVIPPSIHPSTESYVWQGEPWGGERGPTLIDSRQLMARVAALGLATVILDQWPRPGGRHEAFLALAGGFLRYGESGVNPYWEKALPGIIQAIAEASHDEDGGDTRVAEVMTTTVARLKSGDGKVAGFGKLAEMLGDTAVAQIRTMKREVESIAGFVGTVAEPAPLPEPLPEAEAGAWGDEDSEPHRDLVELPDEGAVERDPLEERMATWEPLDLDPYLRGEVSRPEPEILQREDGAYLMYRGRVNMLYGSSESAKTWIALHTCLQEMSKGERVMFIDFEDEPVNTLYRLKLMGAGAWDIRTQFTYIRPEEPLGSMEQNRWGQKIETEIGALNQRLLDRALEETDPSLIIADGMTALYGLHGLDTNDSSGTDVITSWLKRLTRNGRSTVIVIDHTGKNAGKGSLPIGSQHKQAMVQGTLLQVWPLSQPMPGHVGKMELVLLKDRPGQVRERSANAGDKVQVSAEVTLDSTDPERSVMAVGAPQEASRGPVQAIDFRAVQEAERQERFRAIEQSVVDLYEDQLGREYSLPEIRAYLSEMWPEKEINAAVRRLTDGPLVAIGKTKGRRYVLAVADGDTEQEEGDG